MLGRRERFAWTPFFWSQHYDTTISYTGHAEHWDRITVDGKIAERNFTASYWRGGMKLATVTVGRDLDSLRAEAEMEEAIAARVPAAPA